MPKETTKIRVLAIERMFMRGQKLKVEEIQQELLDKYEITAERKTIFDDIYALSVFIPIEGTRGPAGGFQVVDVLKRCDEYEE
jgi:predicted DNA-binding transcriptional regulator YafY